MLGEPLAAEKTAVSRAGDSDSPALTARIFVADQDSESVVRQSLSALGVQDAQFTAGNITAAIAALAKERSPQLLIVDISGDADPLSKMRDLADVCGPNTATVAIGDRNDIAFYQELKSLGASDYFLKPVTRSVFADACKALLAPGGQRSSLRTGKLIFVLGVRGGVGATTIATNLAWQLAEVKRRHTVLVDLDLQTGDAALQLDAAPNRTLFEALSTPERVDKLFLERGVKQVTERLALLAALEPLNANAELSEEAFLWLLDKLVARYRFVIVEVPPAVALQFVWTLRLGSTCLLVSAPSLAGARDLARWNDMIGPNSSEHNARIVINHPAQNGGLSQSDFARALGNEPDVTIPYDRELAAAATLGIKAMQKCHAFQRGLSPIVRDFIGEAAEKSNSLFKRIFS